MARYGSLEQFDATDNQQDNGLGPANCSEKVEEIRKLNLIRYPRSQHQLEKKYGKEQKSTKTLKEKLRDSLRCSKTDVLRYMLSRVPVLSVIKSYKVKQYLLGDVLSGVSAACLHFPQGLAFGLLASLAPKYGLYTSFFPVLLYIFFGTSTHISFGTNAVIALLTSELVESHAHDLSPISTLNETLNNVTSASIVINEQSVIAQKAALASGVSFIVGIILMTMGFLRLGFVTSFLSTSFVSAFTTTAACHILTSQVPKALGVKLPVITGAGKLVYVYIAIFRNIGRSNVGTVVVSLIALIILVFFKDFINERYKDKMKMPVPIDLIIVIVATIVSHYCHLAENYDIAIVGNIPTGLPVPSFPEVKSSIVGESVVMAILIFVLTISMSRVCEMKHDYQVDTDQELIAYGISNFGSSFFWCFASCTAPPRTMILSAMGAKTTLNGIFTAAIMLVILLVLGQYFTSLPISVLATMVIVAVKNLLMQVRQLPVLWRTNKYDFVIWIGTALSGIFIDFPYALYIGVILCMGTVIFQSRMSESYIFSKSDEEDLLLNSKYFPDTVPYDTTTIFKMESSLYFATVDAFRSRLYAATGDPRKIFKCQNGQPEMPIKGEDEDEENDLNAVESFETNHINNIRYVILDCSSVNYIDMNGVNAIRQTELEYRKADIRLMFVRCTLCMLNMLERSNVLSQAISSDRIFPDIFDALHAIEVLEKRRKI